MSCLKFNKLNIGLFVFCFLLKSQLLDAENILTVHDPLGYGAYPAFIDSCIMEIEPHGGYIEASLTLTYSDHGQFSKNSLLEIVHQFELPAGAVVNDLWLWMPDTVMQAIVIDTWTARAIYDSIVSRARDPAFLTKKGNQFKLQVYPLSGGSYRKIRLNYLTPVRWLGNSPTAPLPLRMLQADPTETEMILYFRTRDPIWGNPGLSELPDCQFSAPRYSNGYYYQKAMVQDVSSLAQLTIAYQMHFPNGYWFRSYPSHSDTSYFQIGLDLAEMFRLQSDGQPHHYWIGIDLSGYYNNHPIALLERLGNLLPSFLQPADDFQLVGASDGDFFEANSFPLPADSGSLAQALSKLRQSAFVDSALSNRKRTVLYCDDHAATCWGFQGVEALAAVQFRSHIMKCLHEFSEFDRVAAYDQGYESHLTDAQADSVLSVLDQYFQSGGHFLTFFDYNRDGNDKVASALITGLRTQKNRHRSEIHGVATGQIGRYFPTSYWANTINELAFNDPDVVVEVVDDAGQPVVISKSIHNGLLVVSGIWSFGDDDTQRATFGKPLLGLTNLSRYFQLPELLDSLVVSCKRHPIDRVLLLSNSDTLLTALQSPQIVAENLNRMGRPAPRCHSIQLIDGQEFTPLCVQQKDRYYYGVGYFLKLLADSTGGLHFELSQQDWGQIQAALQQQSIPPRQDLKLAFQVDQGAGSLLEHIEVAPEPANSLIPSFHIGKLNGSHSLHLDVQAKFWGNDQLFEKSLDFALETDTTQRTFVIPAMLANEKIADLFTIFPLDTARIVQWAVEYRLLTDFTAMLCLEPQDTSRYPKPDDPGNASGAASDGTSLTSPATLALSIYPNPFNLSTVIQFSLPYPAQVSIEIFNLVGQLLRRVELSYSQSGDYRFTWDGTDAQGIVLPTGIYFVRFRVCQQNVEKAIWVRKVTLLK